MSDVGEAARQKVMAPIGDTLWHPNERVEHVVPVTVHVHGVAEPMHLVHTSSENALGARKNGRILLSFTPDGAQAVGGVFHFEEGGRKKLQSMYVEDDFRGGLATQHLAAAAKAAGVQHAVGPYSPAGQRAVQRYGFRMTKAEYPVADPPEYAHSNYRQHGGQIVHMAPEQFLAAAPPLEHDDATEDNVQSLVDHIRSGRRLDPALLVMKDGAVHGHDGRHRALAAQRLGITRFPVLVMNHDGSPVRKAEAEGFRYVSHNDLDRDAPVTPEVALVLATDGRGRYLFGKRHDNGQWTLPGGHLNPGEDPVVGAARELYEEAGLRPISLTPLKTVEPTAPGRARLHFFTALCQGAPTNAHDPDQEGAFQWVDARDGLPANVYDHLAGPPGDANLVRQVFDLRKNDQRVWLDAGFATPQGAPGTYWEGVPCMYETAEECPDIDCTHHLAKAACGLLAHPNPTERALALKLGTTTPADLAVGILDPDPWVWRTAFHHPDAHHALQALAAETRDASGMPLWDRHDLLLQDPRLTPEHLEAMVHAVRRDAYLPFEEQAWRLRHLSTHALFRPEFSDPTALQKSALAHEHLRHATLEPSEQHADHAGEATMPHLRHLEAAWTKHQRLDGQGTIPENHDLHGDTGISPKAVYKLPVDGHTEHQRLMVKPYHDVDNELAGWSEATSQQLYHAAGIGHVHQRSFVGRHGRGDLEAPVTVIHLEDAKPLDQVPSTHFAPTAEDDARKVALMDFLTSNKDRHEHNLMVRKDGSLLAIDHGMAFTYAAPWSAPKEFRYFAGVKAPAQVASWALGRDKYADTFRWWAKVAPDVKRQFAERVDLIKKHGAAQRLEEGFNTRAAFLDRMAKEAEAGDLHHGWWDEAPGRAAGNDDEASGIAKALDGADFVHAPQQHGEVNPALHGLAPKLVGTHPEHVNVHAERFATHIAGHDAPHAPVHGTMNGIEPKAVFEHGGHKYLVKKATEGHYNSAWNEMTSQALYHAAGIGHLHQSVHVAPVRAMKDVLDSHGQTVKEPTPGFVPKPGWGRLGATRNRREPADAHALVIKMEPGATYDDAEHDDLEALHTRPENMHDAHRIVLMDAVCGNIDRHLGNVLIRPGGRPLAIDHGLAFQYDHSHADTDTGQLANNEADFPDLLQTQFRQTLGPADPKVWDWYDGAKPAIIRAFEKQVQMIPNPTYRERMLESFHHRLGLIDGLRSGAVAPAPRTPRFAPASPSGPSKYLQAGAR